MRNRAFAMGGVAVERERGGKKPCNGEQCRKREKRVLSARFAGEDNRHGNGEQNRPFQRAAVRGVVHFVERERISRSDAEYQDAGEKRMRRFKESARVCDFEV